MEQTLIQRMIASMVTLIPCGLLLSPADRQACRNNVSNVRLEDGRIDLDPDPNYTTIAQSKSTLLAGCRFDESTFEGPESSTVKNGLMTRAMVDLVNSSNFEIDHRTLTADLNRRVAAYLTQLFPGETLVQRPQLIGQDNRMEEMFLAGFVDCR